MRYVYELSNSNPGVKFTIRCLAFREHGEETWSAVALEMDQWAFGETREEACANLQEVIEGHIGFAIGKNALHVLDQPTEKKWFDLWEKSRGKEKSDYEKVESYSYERSYLISNQGSDESMTATAALIACVVFFMCGSDTE